MTASHPSRAPSLQTIGMSKSFGALRALQDVSIEVPAGSFHALPWASTRPIAASS
jgi:general nucleoside transport system ATP-binding protein